MVRRNHRAIPHGQPDSLASPTNAVRVTGARPKFFSRLRLDGSPRFFIHRGLRIPEPQRQRSAPFGNLPGSHNLRSRALNRNSVRAAFHSRAQQDDTNAQPIHGFPSRLMRVARGMPALVAGLSGQHRQPSRVCGCPTPAASRSQRARYGCDRLANAARSKTRFRLAKHQRAVRHKVSGLMSRHFVPRGGEPSRCSRLALGILAPGIRAVVPDAWRCWEPRRWRVSRRRTAHASPLATGARLANHAAPKPWRHRVSA